ncbi:Nn.00g056470.m01.CDS01 [Neocucurbitaria sp. VM-36]
MNTTRSSPYGRQPQIDASRITSRNTAADPTQRVNHERNPFSQKDDDDEQIQVHFSGQFDDTFPSTSTTQEKERWEKATQHATRRASTKRNSRSYASRMSRQKSRRRELMGRQIKPGITVDTSFTRHKGSAPHQVFPDDDERGAGMVRKPSWFGLGRSSTRNKGLGITKGTPQPGFTHRTNPSIDQNDAQTAISMTPGSKPWQDISPWDRRIPIGISVPTESVSDFSSYQGNRLRAGSDATLVTPSIIITPAAAMQSVWSPDTPFTESDYTPSVHSRNPFNALNSDVPPVPALPAEHSKSQPHNGVYSGGKGAPSHTRNDTLDSAGTAFEEDDDSKRRDRIMSTGTVFEEDDTPLRDKTIDAPLALDTSTVPTPRRSQGWWNFITTPFVMTPNTATWPKNETPGERTPDMPMLPTQYYTSLDAPASPSTYTWSATNSAIVSPLRSTATPDASQGQNSEPHSKAERETNAGSANATYQQTQHPTSTHDRGVTSPLSAMSASPIVSTAAIGTVLMPRQVEEQPRQININIELQDRRPFVSGQTVKANDPPAMQKMHTSSPAPQVTIASSSVPNSSNSPHSLPVFAPPPNFARKGSHFSYDNISRSSSPASTPDLKAPKKHRKVWDFMSLLPFGKGRRQNRQGAQKKKKKKRGVCFWGCCCCLVFLILLAILIPVVVVLTRRNNDKPTTTQPDQDVSNQWLNLPDYPPVPTGISTIAQPEAVEEESGCVAPTTLWSCALPKELQQSVKPNKPDQPNFKIQITFENGTAAVLPKRAANPVSAGALTRSRLLQLRSAVSPSPAPPSDADMNFLGQTTDGNVAPFEGEETPLFITFQDPQGSASRLAKRADPTDPTNITAVIPPPMLASDGTAAPANLLPFPSAQPLRLFNRGKDNEYYGFYTYFDRSIFLKQINGTNRGGNPADTEGGSTKDAANLRCTYSETRFLVQIWTQSEKSKPLLQNSASNASDVFKRPGTFPYPVTVTIDRHGGNPAKKNLYCYEIESDGTIKNEASKRYFQFEDRAFGGNLVNGTQGRDVITGPIDGGTGGCRCQWQNWLN